MSRAGTSVVAQRRKRLAGEIGLIRCAQPQLQRSWRGGRLAEDASSLLFGGVMGTGTGSKEASLVGENCTQIFENTTALNVGTDQSREVGFGPVIRGDGHLVV
jgi:hypothetical protein